MNGAEALVAPSRSAVLMYVSPTLARQKCILLQRLDRLDLIYCVSGVTGKCRNRGGGWLCADEPATRGHAAAFGAWIRQWIGQCAQCQKARVPMVNIVGEHATYHIKYDAPLTSDIEGIVARFGLGDDRRQPMMSD